MTVYVLYGQAISELLAQRQFMKIEHLMTSFCNLA